MKKNYVVIMGMIFIVFIISASMLFHKSSQGNNEYSHLTWDNTTEIIDIGQLEGWKELLEQGVSLPSDYYHPLDEFSTEYIKESFEATVKTDEFTCPEFFEQNAKDSKDIKILQAQYLGVTELGKPKPQAVFKGTDGRYYSTYSLLDTDKEKVLFYERLTAGRNFVQIHGIFSDSYTNNLHIGRKVYSFIPMKFEVFE